MLIFRSISALTKYLEKFSDSESKIGFVPTMGSLHEGHISLVDKSIRKSTLTVVSIFLNPTQFNDNKDLNDYPVDNDADFRKLKLYHDQLILFVPEIKEVYGNNVKTKKFSFSGLDKYMEGSSRTNHFNGVITVVEKLFEIVKPDYAFFGEKDFQQLRIIESFVNDRSLGIEIIRCETKRSYNGLALSSRNKKLNNSSKKIASNLYKALRFARDNFNKLEIPEIVSNIEKKFHKISEISLEYFLIADENKLHPTNQKSNGVKYRAFIAAKINNIRLIDNINLN
ncbi:MAG: pantoate--beta-alanine ligase [Bacteroidetes bacterium MED-G13]|nr:MAG: pantoate--beta-alanine ligase [Bacteroidetes bacterium MED-G13]